MDDHMPEQIEETATSKWKDTAAGIAGCFPLYLGFAFGGIALLILLLRGVGWIVENVYPWTAFAASIAVFVVVPSSLSLSISRKSRVIGTFGLTISWCVIGLHLWVWSLIIAYTLAGVFWLIVGLLFAGIGVVPVAFIAALISREWSVAGEVLVAVVIVFAIQMFCYFLVKRAK